jgi:hypothetical protein
MNKYPINLFNNYSELSIELLRMFSFFFNSQS